MKTVDNIRNEVLKLLIMDQHGICIPQLFAEAFEQAKRNCPWLGTNFEQANISKSDWEYLKQGPETEGYWDTWSHVLDNYNLNGNTLHHDGDLWSIDTTLLEKYSEEEQEQFWESVTN